MNASIESERRFKVNMTGSGARYEVIDRKHSPTCWAVCPSRECAGAIAETLEARNANIRQMERAVRDGSAFVPAADDIETIKQGLSGVAPNREWLDAMTAALDRVAAKFSEQEQRIAAYEAECFDVEQDLGRALGYPVMAPEEGGDVDVGDHTPSTIAAEAAQRLADRADPGASR